MVPENLAGTAPKGTRGARLPPHSKTSMRRATGLEAAIVDNTVETIYALDPADTRTFDAKVAGPAAPIVAKMHKLMERLGNPHRLNDKDAHDIYRILRAIDMGELAEGFRTILRNPISEEVTQAAITGIRHHLASGPEADFAHLAGRAEAGIGEPSHGRARDLVPRGRPC